MRAPTPIPEMTPARLLATALELGPAQPSSTPRPGARFGGYEVIEEIGRGGMGLVFTALATRSNRIVALKVPHPALGADEALARRFRTEAEAAAALDHRSILPIYEAGEIDGTLFFTMKFAESGNLAQRLPDFAGQPRKAAALIASAAEALHHAHERGLLHRDLKPQNILLQPGRNAHGEDELQPLIADFGLARWLHRESDLTHSHAVLGTPGYLAPESLHGAGSATVAGDIFSLGSILYHVLTGQPPFAGDSVAETLRRVVEGRFSPPRQLAPEIPRDLEAICLRCLQFEPARRYASAAELAADLRHFLAGESVAARHPHPLERAWRWTRRYPVLAALSVALAAALFALGWATISAVASREAALRAEAQRVATAERSARERLRDTLLSNAAMTRLSGRAGQRFGTLKSLQEAWAIQSGSEVRSAAIACLALPDVVTEGTLSIQSLAREGPVAFDLSHNRFATAPARGEISLGDLASGRPLGKWGDASWPISAVLGFSPDGNFLTVLGENGRLRVWNVEAQRIALERPVPSATSFVDVVTRPCDFISSEAVVVGDPAGGVVCIDLASGTESWRVATAQPVSFLACSPTGRMLAVAEHGGRQVELLDLATRAVQQTYRTGSFVSALSWSQDGGALAVGSQDKAIYLCRPGQADAPQRLIGNVGSIAALAFNPGGNVLASSATDGSIRLWRLSSGSELLDCGFDSESGTPLLWSGDGQRLSFVTRGRRGLAAYRLALPEAARLLSVPDGERLVETWRNIDLSADGALLATVTDQGARLWDVTADREIERVPKDRSEWLGARFAPGDQRVWLCGWNSGLRSQTVSREGDRWTLHEPEAVRGLSGAVLCGFSADGKRLAFLNGHEQCFLLAEPARIQKPIILRQDNPYALALSPDGHWAATSSYRGETILIWDLSSAKLAHELAADARVLHPVFSPDGQWLALPAAQGISLWRVPTWNHEFDLPIKERIDDIAFVPGGRSIAVQTSRDVRLHRFPGGAELARFNPPGPAGRSMSGSFCFRNDGRQLAVQASDGAVMIWDLLKARMDLRKLGFDWED